MTQNLMDTTDPNKKLGFRTKDGCLQPIEVVTEQTGLVIEGNIETRTYTETTKVLLTWNPNE